jgi:uncharacterized protein (DUF58 family)
MDWSKVKRKTAAERMPAGAYTNLDDLIKIQFKARDFSFLPHHPVSSVLSGRYASRLRGRGLNFEELRRYFPGDDIRTMDWKVTARTRTPHVRVYTEEKDRAVLLLVDQRLNMFFGTREKFKSVTAAELTALAAWRAVGVGDRVGAIVFNDKELAETKPQRSKQTVMSILGDVVRMNHALHPGLTIDTNRNMLNESLRRAIRLSPHDALVVAIGDFFDVDDVTSQLVTELAEHNDVIAFLIHDPIRLKPPSHSLTLSDGTRQLEADFGNPKLRDLLVRDYREEQERIEVHLRKLSAPLLMVSNEGDVVEQVRKLLGIPGRAS